MTDKKEEPFEDRFALKVKPDTRLKQVRVFKKETIDKFKKLNSRRKKEEKRRDWRPYTWYSRGIRRCTKDKRQGCG